MQSKNKLLRLVESALLLAVASVLSMVKLLDLPYGGSITACSALPLLLVAYRHGTVWGLFTGFAYALIQLVMGLSTVSYFTSPLSIVAVIFLDYILAFTAFGLGGVFRRRCTSQTAALLLGGLLICVLRYVFHVISGCTVWAGLSIPDNAALVYSLAYNATYMLPETIVTLLGTWYLSRAIDVTETVPSRAKTVEKLSPTSLWMNLLSAAALLVATVWNIVLVFSQLQDAETGDFIITGLSNVDWLQFTIVTVVGFILSAVFRLLSHAAGQKTDE